MSDHPKDIPPTTPPDSPPGAPTATWEDAPAFREIFLAHVPPEAAEAFRHAGRHLYDAALDVDLYELAEPWVRARVRALAKDLRVTAEVFATLADSREVAGLTIEEHELATRCKVWAGEVVAVVLGIEGALDPEVRS